MTKKEFDAFRIEVGARKFSSSDFGILSYGISRKQFQRDNLKKIIEAGKTVRDSKTVAHQLKRWQRKLERMESAQTRLEALSKELPAARLTVTLPRQTEVKMPTRLRHE